MSIRFEFPSFMGESILITTPKFVMLIDGGCKAQYKKLKEKLISLRRPIDLVVLTHTDNDHIGGLIELFGDAQRPDVKTVWFNTFDDVKIFHKNRKRTAKTSYPDGIDFYSLIEGTHINHVDDVRVSAKYNDYFVDPNLKLTVLSPTEKTLARFYKEWRTEIFKKRDPRTSARGRDWDIPLKHLQNKKVNKDFSRPNGASIAFLLEYGNRSFLLCGDAYSGVLEASLENLGFSESNPLKVDVFKLPHHGSSRNVTIKLLKMVRARSYLICSKGMKSLPHKKTLYDIFELYGETVEIILDDDIFSSLIDSELAIYKDHFKLEEELEFEKG